MLICEDKKNLQHFFNSDLFMQKSSKVVWIMFDPQQWELGL